jgi:hypothetical protein
MQESGFRIWFLETGYFFSKILSEFRKKIVAQQVEPDVLICSGAARYGR